MSAVHNPLFTKWTTAAEVVESVLGSGASSSAAAAPRTIVITGSNSGIGFESALALRRAGLHVVCCARSLEKAQETVDRIEAAAASTPPLLSSSSSALTTPGVIDLADLDSIRAFAASLEGQPVWCLLNNAGVMQLPAFRPSKQGFEMTFAVNFLGHWLLTELLKPNLRAGAAQASGVPARVVNVSSAAHYSVTFAKVPPVGKIGDPIVAREQYTNGWQEYAVSKMYQVLHAQHLAREEAGTIIAFSLHPGVIATGLNRNARCCTFTWLLYCWPRQLYCCCCCCPGWLRKTAPQGAAPSVRACLDPALVAASGAYLHETCQPARPRLPPGLDADALMRRCSELCSINGDAAAAASSASLTGSAKKSQ